MIMRIVNYTRSDSAGCFRITVEADCIPDAHGYASAFYSSGHYTVQYLFTEFINPTWHTFLVKPVVRLQRRNWRERVALAFAGVR